MPHGLFWTARKCDGSNETNCALHHTLILCGLFELPCVNRVSVELKNCKVNWLFYMWQDSIWSLMQCDLLSYYVLCLTTYTTWRWTIHEFAVQSSCDHRFYCCLLSRAVLLKLSCRCVVRSLCITACILYNDTAPDPSVTQPICYQGRSSGEYKYPFLQVSGLFSSTFHFRHVTGQLSCCPCLSPAPSHSILLSLFLSDFVSLAFNMLLVHQPQTSFYFYFHFCLFAASIHLTTCKILPWWSLSAFMNHWAWRRQSDWAAPYVKSLFSVLWYITGVSG